MKISMMRCDSSERVFEAEFREHYLPLEIQQLTLGVWVWTLPYLAFSYMDYLLFRDSQVLSNILLLRIGYALISIFLLIYLKGKIRHHAVLDRVVLCWALLSAALNVVVNILRTGDHLAGFIFDLVLIFSLYIFVLNRTLVRTIPALALSVFDVGLALQSPDPSLDRLALVVAFCLANVIGVLFSERVSHSRLTEFISRREDMTIRSELERLAATDALTGVYNRRRLLELATDAFYRFQRYGRPFSLVLMDMDGFKRVNDTFGHMMGDAVLIKFAQMINSASREADALGRMGGDEFCLVLPETQTHAAAKMAERILSSCAGMEIAGQALDVHVTASIGITQALPEDVELDEVLARADVALYRAKNEGRNRMVIV